ncbi:MAG: MFS transporter [Acidimicrobiia bacterium]|nr:MFS transporter [Acidimicrobiia bacterium]
MSDGLPRGRLALLGVVTIGAYGAWFYSFGVLLDPIIEDTGWSEAALTGAYALSLLLGGIGGLGGGWLLDRFGSRLVFAAGAALTMASFVAAAAAQSVAVFTAAGAVAGGSLAALAFYHVTQTVAVRIAPADPNRAIAVLTIWGAFASVLAIPAAAWLEARFGWRTALVVLGAFATTSLLAAAVSVPTPGMPGRQSSLAAIRARLGNTYVRRFLFAQAVGGMTASVIIVYQVPAMTSAGLSIGLASTIGGLRGLAQLGGRLPLAPLVSAIGVGRSMQLAYVVLALGGVLLSVSGTLLPAVLFAICAGFGIGALSALAGMYTAEVFDSDSLGTAMGFTSLVFGAVGAAGPALAGWTAEVSGSRAWPVLGAAALAAIAAGVIKPVEG